MEYIYWVVLLILMCNHMHILYFSPFFFAIFSYDKQLQSVIHETILNGRQTLYSVFKILFCITLNFASKAIQSHRIQISVYLKWFPDLHMYWYYFRKNYYIYIGLKISPKAKSSIFVQKSHVSLAPHFVFDTGYFYPSRHRLTGISSCSIFTDILISSSVKNC